MTEEKEEVKNEFDTIEAEDSVPDQEFAPTPGGQEDLISSGSAGTVYDFTKAPEGTKAPPRVDLDGQELTLLKAEIILPPADRPWEKTKAGDKEFKYCSFIMHYDAEGQREFYSGVRVFKRDGEKYSHPTMTRDRKNQASHLLGLYADYKKKDINECSLKEFMSYLNSQPKVVIKVVEVTNPTNNNVIKKNMIGNFI